MTIKKQQRARGDQVRKRILEAAEVLFVQQGFAGTSVSQITKRAQVNQSLIYHHFGNKANLWRAVKQSIISPEFDSFAHILKRASLTGKELIQQFLQTRMEMATQKFGFQKMILWQSLETKRDALFYTPRYGKVEIMACIKALQRKKELRSDWSEQVIFTLLSSTVMGLLISMPTVKESSVWRQCVRAAEQMLLNTLLCAH